MTDIFTCPCIATPQGTASLADLLASPEAYTDISEPHLTRQAFLRLLLAMASVTMENQPLPGDMPLWGTPGQPGFLQVTGLPEASIRSPQAIMDLMDGSGPALVPRNFLAIPTEADLIKALITAYFCDRPGLKAQVKGLPISGPKPSHMGQLVAWKWGDNLADFLELNAVPTSSWVPWWKRPIDYGETLDADNPDLVQYLMWPWRRLQAFPGGIVVAAGVKCTLAADPWALGRASLRHLSKGLAEFELTGPARVSGMILNQASPIAWKEWNVAG